MAFPHNSRFNSPQRRVQKTPAALRLCARPEDGRHALHFRFSSFCSFLYKSGCPLRIGSGAFSAVARLKMPFEKALVLRPRGRRGEKKKNTKADK